MTDIIQAQYEQLENIATGFGQQAESNAELIKRLQQNVAQLQKGGWEGQGSSAFFSEMEGEIFPAIRRLAEALEQARSTTLDIKGIIQAAEEEAAAPFQNQMQIANILKGNGTGGTEDGGFNWFGFGGSMADGLDNVILQIGKTPYEDFKSIGRFINTVIGNKRGGWVGQMDDLAHFLKKDLGLKGLAQSSFGHFLENVGNAASLGFGVADDLSKGYGWDKALVTESAELVASIGVRAGLRLIPGVGTPLLIYDGAMFAGNLLAGGLTAAGFEEQGTWLQNSLEKVHIDHYIDIGMDWAYEKAPVVIEVGKKVLDAGAGFIDDSSEVVGNPIDRITDFFK